MKSKQAASIRISQCYHQVAMDTNYIHRWTNVPDPHTSCGIHKKICSAHPFAVSTSICLLCLFAGSGHWNSQCSCADFRNPTLCTSAYTSLVYFCLCYLLNPPAALSMPLTSSQVRSSPRVSYVRKKRQISGDLLNS